MIKVLQHLLPRGRAWVTTIDKQLRQFIEGLSNAAEDIRGYFMDRYEDWDPQLTDFLSEWERQFNLPNSQLSEQGRRDRLDAAWKAVGGQSPRYIQDTLQQAGFDVYVHEWWEPVPGRPGGGSVGGDVTPVARNPFDYLWDGSSPRQFIGCGHNEAYCDGDLMYANAQNDPPGYPLVNKVVTSTQATIGCGSNEMFCGGNQAAAGVTTVSYGLKQYVMPADPDTYPYYLYIGGETFPELATVPLSRKDEFEDLCLKICPAQQWLGILVSYT